MEQLGRAKSVKVQKETTVIVDGCGEKEAINDRIAQIKQAMQETTSDFDMENFRRDLQNWLAAVGSYPCRCSYRGQR